MSIELELRDQYQMLSPMDGHASPRGARPSTAWSGPVGGARAGKAWLVSRGGGRFNKCWTARLVAEMLIG